MKHEAIMEIYPTVKRVTETIDGVITAFDESGNEVSLDMSAVETKVTELETSKETKKQNKVSAYRKMEMTDDEILAIDPTLADYL